MGAAASKSCGTLCGGNEFKQKQDNKHDADVNQEQYKKHDPDGKVYVQLGITACKFVLQGASNIPFPGVSVVTSALSSLLDMVSQAMANKDNLQALSQRCFDVMELMTYNWTVLEERQEHLTLLSRFDDLLKEVTAYTREYCGRHWLVRMLTSNNDQATFTDLRDRLQNLVADATLSITASVNSNVSTILERINKALPYVDHSSAAQQLVKDAGGIEQVMGDPAKMDALMQKLSAGEQVVSLKVQRVQDALALVAAELDNGIHRLIQQPDMKLLWKRLFLPHDRVEWFYFWAAFPAKLSEIAASEQVHKVQALLAAEEARQSFQKHIELDGEETVSVKEIMLAFPDKDEPLSTAVQKLIGGCGGTATAVSTTPTINCKLFQLPLPGTGYTGRAKDSDAIVAYFAGGAKAVCIVADAGMGKSCVALDMGSKLWAAGTIPGGALMVDMREARQPEDILGRFCAALNVPQGGDTQSGIIARLRALTASTSDNVRELLLVVDNAEDPLRSSCDGCTAFTRLLDEVLDEVASVKLLLTSRQQMELCRVVNHTLGGLSTAASEQLVSSIAGGVLKPADVTFIAAQCAGVPLLLRLVSKTLKSGWLRMENVLELMRVPEGSDKAAVVPLITLRLLPPRQQEHLAMLSIFPSDFDKAGAAAVLELEEVQANSSLQVLELHSCTLGPEHRDTADSSFNLAVCLAAQDRAADAELYFRQALAVYSRTLEPQHADTLDCMERVIKCLRAQDKNAEADALELLEPSSLVGPSVELPSAWDSGEAHSQGGTCITPVRRTSIASTGHANDGYSEVAAVAWREVMSG